MVENSARCHDMECAIAWSTVEDVAINPERQWCASAYPGRGENGKGVLQTSRLGIRSLCDYEGMRSVRQHGFCTHALANV